MEDFEQDDCGSRELFAGFIPTGLCALQPTVKKCEQVNGRTEMRVSASTYSYDEHCAAWPTRLMIVQKLDHSKEHNNTTKYPDQKGNLWCWVWGAVTL